MTNNPSIRDQAEALLVRLGSGAGEKDFDVNSFVHRLLAKHRKIALVWCVEDVQSERPDLSDDQAWDVLHEVERKHDAEVGISWTTLNCMAEMLFGHAPETDEFKEAQP